MEEDERRWLQPLKWKHSSSFSVCQQICLKQKKPTQWMLSSKRENHFIPGHTPKNIWLLGLFLVAILSLSLLHLSVKIWKSHLMHPWIHISALRGKTQFIFWQSFTHAPFSPLCHSRWKHVCDHGQHFPFLKCLLLLLLCQCVGEENGSWKTPLFGFALSMETGP